MYKKTARNVLSLVPRRKPYQQPYRNYRAKPIAQRSYRPGGRSSSYRRF